MTFPKVPLFIQVAETIKKRIINYEYSPGEAIPSASEMEEAFNVSNITIRRAMELLSNDGYIVPRQGKRAQVADRVDKRVEIEITGDFWNWIDMVAGRKMDIKATVIDRRVIDCPKPIRKLLDLGRNEKVERIKRIRERKGKPISYFINYASADLLGQLPSREIEKHTFIKVFQKICDMESVAVEQRVQAVTADIDLAAILKVKFGFPLFFIQNVIYAAKRKPTAVTHMYFRSDRYVYTINRQL